MVRDFPANGLRKSIFSLTFGYMHMDRWRFYWKSKSSFPIGSWSCCFSAVYVEMFGALPKPVPQDLQLQTRCQNKNDRRHSWSWWAGCSCEHLLAGKWDETPKTTKTTKGLTSPKNSRKKILQVYIYTHKCWTSWTWFDRTKDRKSTIHPSFWVYLGTWCKMKTCGCRTAGLESA